MSNRWWIDERTLHEDHRYSEGEGRLATILEDEMRPTSRRRYRRNLRAYLTESE